GPGVVAAEGAGEGGLGVVSGHPDRVGDQLGLGVQPDHVRVVLAERDLRGGGFRGGLGGFEAPAGHFDGSAEPGEHRVGDHGGGAGGGAAQRVQLALPAGFGGGEGFLRGLDGGGCRLLGRVGDQAGRVVGGDGVAVQGVQGEVRAGVPEVVFLPPPAGHPVDDAGGGQAGGVAGGEDVDLAALVAAGDLPEREDFALVLPAGDGQLDAGFGEVVGVGAAVVAGLGHGGERVIGQGGDVLAGLGLAVGEQVEPGCDDVREQAG